MQVFETSTEVWPSIRPGPTWVKSLKSVSLRPSLAGVSLFANQDCVTIQTLQKPFAGCRWKVPEMVWNWGAGKTLVLGRQLEAGFSFCLSWFCWNESHALFQTPSTSGCLLEDSAQSETRMAFFLEGLGHGLKLPILILKSTRPFRRWLLTSLLAPCSKGGPGSPSSP